MSSPLVAEIRAALSAADNPVAAARALGKWAIEHRPEYETQRDAIRVAAERALAPFFENGDASAAKASAWAVLDVAWTARKVTNEPPKALAGLVRLSDVEPERIKWLWPGRIPLGKLTLLDGDPGLGKSALTLDLAARVTIGDVMPDGAQSDLSGPAGVVLLTAEDGLGDTVRPRLDVMGADPSRVAALQFVTKEDGDAFPTIRDVPAIEAAIDHVEARLLVVDPLMAYLGGDVNSHRDQDVRGALAGLVDLVDRHSVSVLAVRHLNKSSGGSPLYRGGGSIGLIAAARSGLLVAADPDDETGQRRILASTKANLAAIPPALAYHLETTHGAVRIAWEGETQHRAADLLVAKSEEERSAIDEAKEFILDQLKEGPRPAVEMIKGANSLGISKRTLQRAKKILNVESKRHGFGRGAELFWSLPAMESQGGWTAMEVRRLAPNVVRPDLCCDSPSATTMESQHIGVALYAESDAIMADLGRALRVRT